MPGQNQSFNIDANTFMNALRAGMAPPQFQYDPGRFQGLSSNPLGTGSIGTISMQQSDFFGPFGLLALQGIDSLLGGIGLVRPGYGGMPTPVFNTAMNLRNTGLSSFQMQMANMNGTAFGAAFGGMSAGQQASMAKAFNTQGDSNWARFYNANPGFQYAMDFVEGAARNPALSPMLNSLLNWATGHDSGAGASVAAQRSMDIAGRFGGRLGTFSDVMSQDFQDARAGLGSIIGEQAKRQTWSSYQVRNRNVYGASEALVANIVADALQSGSIDMDRVGEGFSGMSGNDLVKNAVMATGERYRLTAERERMDSRLKGMGDNDPETARLKEKRDELDRRIAKVTEEATRLGEAIQRGTEPLVEAVTRTVDTLNTFYHDETQSVMALNRLTGGQGMKDRRLAERVNRQMQEIRDTAILAGVSPEIAARQVEQLQSQLMTHGSGIGAGNALSGQLALGLGQMSMSTIRGMNGNPDAQRRAMNAFSEFAGSYDQSEGKKFSIMLEAALQSGKIDKATYDRLYALGTSGDHADLERAKRELFVRTTGSVKAGQRLFDNPQAIADMSNRLSPEAAQRAGDFATSAVMAEMNRMGARADRTESRRNAEDRLRESGYSAIEIRNAEESAAGSAIRDFLASSDDTKDALRAYDAKLKSYMDRGMSREQAERLTNKWFNNNFVKKGNVLTREQKDAIEGGIATAQQGALNSMETHGLTEGDLAVVEGDSGLSSFMSEIGAIGSDGKLSAQAFGQSSADLYRAMLREADTLGLDKSEIAKEFRQFRSDLNSKDPAKRRRAMQTFRSRMSGLSGGENAVILRGELKHEGEYRNTDVLLDERLSGLTEEERAEYKAEGTSSERRAELEAEAAKRDDVFRSLSKNAEFAKILRGFKTEDARWTWASLQHQLSTEFKEGGDLTADEKKRYDELSGKDEKSLTDEERAELQRLQTDPRGVKYGLEKRRDEAQREGVKQSEGVAEAAVAAVTTAKGLDELAEKAKAAGVELKDFYDTIHNVVEAVSELFGLPVKPKSGEGGVKPASEAAASGGESGGEGGGSGVTSGDVKLLCEKVDKAVDSMIALAASYGTNGKGVDVATPTAG